MIEEVWVLQGKMVAHNLISDKGSDGEYFVQVSRDTLDQPALNARRARSSPTETEVSLRRAISRQAAGISMFLWSLQFWRTQIMNFNFILNPAKCDQ